MSEWRKVIGKYGFHRWRSKNTSDYLTVERIIGSFDKKIWKIDSNHEDFNKMPVFIPDRNKAMKFAKDFMHKRPFKVGSKILVIKGSDKGFKGVITDLFDIDWIEANVEGRARKGLNTKTTYLKKHLLVI